MSKTNKQCQAARLLEREIDGAANGEGSQSSEIREAVDLIVGAAAERASAEILPVLQSHLNQAVELMRRRPIAKPFVPIEPEWDVFVVYRDAAWHPTGKIDKIGRYASEAEAGQVANILNRLTPAAYIFKYEQV